MIPSEGRGDADLIDPWAVEERSSVSGVRSGVESDRAGSAQAGHSAVVSTAVDSEDVVPDPSCAPETVGEPPDAWGGDGELEDAGAFEDLIEVASDEDSARHPEEATYGLIAESAPERLNGSARPVASNGG